MKVVVTGGGGFLGGRLGRRLLERGELTSPEGRPAPIDRLVLADAALPSAADWTDDRVELVRCDVADPLGVRRLVDRDDISVFHLASIVSGQAEQEPDLARRVNIDGTRAVLDALKRRKGRQRLVATSTYATFGGLLPDVVGDETKLTPQTTYGVTKAVLELLVNDYTRRGDVDGRTARLPTVIIRPGAANAALSSVASAIFREPICGRPYTVPVDAETRMAVTNAKAAVEGLIVLHEADGDQLGTDRAVCFPSLSASVGEMVDVLNRECAGSELGELTWTPDPMIQAIVSSWPTRVAAERALAIGVPPPDPLEHIVRDAVAERLVS